MREGSGTGGREGGRDGGREGALRKGTSEEGTKLGMGGARERGEGESGRRREGGCNGSRKRYREERGMNGDREGGNLQGMYPDEDTGQYTVCIAQNYTKRGPCPGYFGIGYCLTGG